jgi:hypothetical protein
LNVFDTNSSKEEWSSQKLRSNNLNWFLESLHSSEPLLEVRRHFVIDTEKLKEFVRFKELAYAQRKCAYCEALLSDRRKIFCDYRCRRIFNRKFSYFVVTWRQVRYRTLRRDHWSCVKCGRRAREVDHIIPLALGGSEFEVANCQSLCRACHIKKTVGEIRNRAAKRAIREGMEVPVALPETN